MRAGRTGRCAARRARLGGGRHQVAIICRYVCYVTNTGTGQCHGYWKGGVSRIPQVGGGKRLTGQRVAGFGQRAAVRLPEHPPGEPAVTADLCREVNVFGAASGPRAVNGWLVRRTWPPRRAQVSGWFGGKAFGGRNDFLGRCRGVLNIFA
jgi:hypothetical protein